jgi:hypothetical protein
MVNGEVPLGHDLLQIAVLSEYRRYHRTQSRMITSSKCRPRNSAGRLPVTIRPTRSAHPHLCNRTILLPKHLCHVGSPFSRSALTEEGSLQRPPDYVNNLRSIVKFTVSDELRP